MGEISKTADQALVLLSAVAEDQPVTATRLCRRLGMNRTIAHRLLTTLHERGFVRRIGEQYAVGATVLHLAQRVEPLLRDVAFPVLERLSADLGETVVLQVVDGAKVVILSQVIGRRHVVRVEHNLIASHPLRLGASGRALLAYAPARTVRGALDGLSDTETQALLERLGVIRQTGYETSHDELQEGVHAVAAPVLDNGVAVGALAVLAPVTRAAAVSDRATDVVAAAREIESTLRATRLGEAAVR